MQPIIDADAVSERLADGFQDEDPDVYRDRHSVFLGYGVGHEHGVTDALRIVHLVSLRHAEPVAVAFAGGHANAERDADLDCVGLAGADCEPFGDRVAVANNDADSLDHADLVITANRVYVVDELRVIDPVAESKYDAVADG